MQLGKQCEERSGEGAREVEALQHQLGHMAGAVALVHAGQEEQRASTALGRHGRRRWHRFGGPSGGREGGSKLTHL